jgi:hypothetical protein
MIVHASRIYPRRPYLLSQSSPIIFRLLSVCVSIELAAIVLPPRASLMHVWFHRPACPCLPGYVTPLLSFLFFSFFSFLAQRRVGEEGY